MSADPRRPDEFFAHIVELDRRLRAIEAAPQPSGMTLKDGTFAVTDQAGNVRALLGNLLDGHYGLVLLDKNGIDSFRATEGGLEFPAQNLPYRTVNTPVNVSSGSFTATWESSFAAISADSIVWGVTVTADAATTGEARLALNGGTLISAVQSFPTGQTSLIWKWKVPLVPGNFYTAGVAYQVQLGIRVASGAGSVHAYAPDSLYLAAAGTVGATATGV